MPSDERMSQALNAIESRRAAFQSALGTTVDQIDHYLAEHSQSANGSTHRAEAELGPFASDRIDMDRFSQLFQTATIDGRVRDTVERVQETLAELITREGRLYLVDVPKGTDLAGRVSQAYDEIGRAFGAARVFDAARSGADPDRRNALALGSFPFARWTARERAMTPPLVVTVDGDDLQPGGLAQFMDGSSQIVLLVRGPAPAAPLASVITPRTLVLQTHDGSGLDRLASYDGPGIAAWMPESAARFIHDPRAGDTPAARIAIEFVPDEPPTRPVGGSSVFQQTEGLAQLDLLTALAAPGAFADTAPAAPVEVAASAEAAPADKLAAWLLAQADVEGLD